MTEVSTVSADAPDQMDKAFAVLCDGIENLWPLLRSELDVEGMSATSFLRVEVAILGVQRKLVKRMLQAAPGVVEVRQINPIENFE